MNELNQFGPFFECGQWAPGEGWRPILETRWQTADDYSADLRRVEASTWFLGIAARLVSPAIGSVVVAEKLAEFSSRTVWTQTRAGEPQRFAVSGSPAATSRVEAGERIGREMADGLFAPMIEQLHGDTGLPKSIAWGNVASAAMGAAAVICSVRPDLTASTELVVRTLLQHDRLASAGTFDNRPPTGAFGFVRRSCCLYYRLPGGGTCGDCILNHRGSRPR